MAKKKTKRTHRDRKEQRFEPQSTASPTVVSIAGGLGAAVMGAGFYGQFLRAQTAIGEPMRIGPWLIAGGAIAAGAAIWFGTSGDAPLRVGDGGIGVEKDGVRRIPWYALESLTWDAQKRAVIAKGKDETGVDLTIVAPSTSQPQACAWMVKEAKDRVRSVVDVPEDAAIAEAKEGGTVVPLEAVQIVGRRCADSGNVITYEPDGRVCSRCERVYHRRSLPAACACGAPLGEVSAPAEAAAKAGAGTEGPVPA